jgi:hypothetical protein
MKERTILEYNTVGTWWGGFRGRAENLVGPERRIQNDEPLAFSFWEVLDLSHGPGLQ